nr:uncharacterized protein LOC129137313 [Pan troglodytes]
MVQRLRCRSLPTWTPTPHSSIPSSVGTPKALPYPECPWAQTATGGAGWLEGLVASLTFLWIQVSLKTSALGSSVEEVEQLIGKHEVFLKVLTAQDKKEAALRERLKTLRRPRVRDRLPILLQRRVRVKELAESRGHALHASLLMASFTQATTQVRGHPQPRAFHWNHTRQFSAAFTPQHCEAETGSGVDGFPRGCAGAQNMGSKPLCVETPPVSRALAAPGQERWGREQSSPGPQE